MRTRMQIAKNKTAAISIAIFLIISMGASMLLIPSANAHSPPYQIKTYALVTANPATVGLGQTTVIYAFLGNAPPPSSAIVNTYRFHNYTVILVAPSGNTTTLHYDTIFDTTGAQTIQFTPVEVGTYNITFNYGGQTLHDPVDQPTPANNPQAIASSYVNDTYLPSSATCTLAVQQDSIPTYPDSYPLPTEYWTRPIYGENPYWWSISSNWLGTGSPANTAVSAGTITGIGMSSLVQRYPGDAVGSLTSHVMWTKPIQSGGVVGGNNFPIQGDTYFEGSAYSQRYTNPIILNGKLYYNPPVNFLGTISGPTTCVDLVTGEVIWQRSDVPAPVMGYIYDLQDPNQHGVWPAMLIGPNSGGMFGGLPATWQVYDADTGNALFNISGVPSGTVVQGPQGEQLRYVMTDLGTSTNHNYVLAEWNFTKLFRGTGFHPMDTDNSPVLQNATGGTVNPQTGAFTPTTITNPPSTTSQSIINGSVFNSSLNTNRFDWNVSINSWRATMSGAPTILNAIYGDYMICRNGSYPSLTGQTNSDGSLVNANYTYFKVDINPKSTTFGQALWWRTINVPMDRSITYGGLDPTVDIFVEGIKETRNFIGYSVNDGSTVFGPTPSQTALDYFGNPIYPYIASQLAYGKLYSYAYGGLLYCYDLTNGDLLWTYGNGGVPGNNTDSGFQAPGYYPGFIQAVGNGVIYIAVTEHTIETPIFKGSFTRAINATDGTEIWTINSYTGEFAAVSYAIADGYTNFFNGIDNQIYTLGRGPTALTVSAPDLSAASSQPVVIRGTVTDVSSGTKQTQLAGRFANGVPVASDASMSEWMGYLYQQKPLPTNYTGVEVTINVVDSNNNFRTIGTTTTDATGAYNLVWQPDIAGKYTVVATFAGTNGYWPSSATTAFNVMEAQPTATPVATAQPSMADLYFVPAIAGLFVAIIVVGAVVILMLRKTLMLRKRQ